jgi:hypothetical protein
MAWQIADHWGNRLFLRPAPRAEVLAAVLLHDAGWSEFDRSPGVDDDCRPITFNRMPPEKHLDIWRASVDRAESHSRYAGLLVASHFVSLADMKIADLSNRGERYVAERVQAFKSELQNLSKIWRGSLATDSRYEHALEGRGWHSNAALLTACDRIAVFLCAVLPRPFTADGVRANGETEQVVFESIDSRRLKVRPWPFIGDKVRLQCEGRRLGAQNFKNGEELRRALASAPTVRQSFTLLRPSSSG